MLHTRFTAGSPLMVEVVFSGPTSTYQKSSPLNLTRDRWTGAVPEPLLDRSDNASCLTIRGNKFHDGTDSRRLSRGPATADINSYGNLTQSMIADNSFLSSNDYGVILDPNTSPTAHADRNRIEKNTFQNKNYYGVALYGQSSFKTQNVDFNEVEHNTFRNIASRIVNRFGSNGGECIYAVNANDSDITGNYCENAMVNRVNLVLPAGAISLSDSARGRIRDNTVINSHYHCISVSNGPPADQTGAIISGNVCERPAHDGIIVKGAAYVRSSHNTIEFAGEAGILVDSSSTFFQSDHDIVRMSGFRAGGAGVDVAGNYASISFDVVDSNARSGIVISGDQAVLTGNIARNNSQSAPGVYYGFVLSGKSGLTMQDNRAIDDQKGTIRVVNGGSGYRQGDVVTMLVNGAPRGRVLVSNVRSGSVNEVLALDQAASPLTPAPISTIGGSGSGLAVTFTGIPPCPNPTQEHGYFENNSYAAGTLRLIGNQAIGLADGRSLWSIANTHYIALGNSGLPDRKP